MYWGRKRVDASVGSDEKAKFGVEDHLVIFIYSERQTEKSWAREKRRERGREKGKEKAPTCPIHLPPRKRKRRRSSDSSPLTVTRES